VKAWRHHELVMVLVGSAQVLASLSLDFDNYARRLAGLGEEFGPRLRLYSDDAAVLAGTLRQLSERVRTTRPDAGGGR
jgi:hypothetical protein